MANTKVQLEAHRWIISEYLPTRFKQGFKEELVDLMWGGEFKFDAVSEDGTIVANITTSAAKTAQGKPSIGKFHKIKSDVLYLLHTKTPGKRIQVFTEADMRDHFVQEKKSGRFPPEIDLIHVELPTYLKIKLWSARQSASKEVTPKA